MPIVAFCAPPPPTENYPSKIVRESYRLLAELGVDFLIGNDEVFGQDDVYDGYVFQAIDYCKEFGISYLVRDMIAHEFTAQENCSRYSHKPFKKLTDEEKEDLKQRYLASLSRYMTREGVVGVTFIDEPGADLFEGVAFANQIFKEAYPDKLFYVNHICHLADDRTYRLGNYIGCVSGGPDDVLNLPTLTPERRFERYEIFMDRYLEKIPHVDLFSYDAYPMQNLGGFHYAVNRCLYDMQIQVMKKMRGLNKEYWNFIQLSKWDEYTRMVNYNEIAMQINVSLALGAKGIELFPTFFPNDFLHLEAFGGAPVDQYGKPTEIFYSAQRAILNVKETMQTLLEAKYLGFRAFGKFRDYEDSGYTPQDLRALPAGEAIFQGEFDWKDDPVSAEEIEVDASSQVLVGYFRIGDQSGYLLVNDSLRMPVDFTVTFKKEKECTVLRDNVREISRKDQLRIEGLPCGECVLIITK